MKRIPMYSMVSIVMLWFFSSATLAQDLSASRPRRVKDLQQQVSTDRAEFGLAYSGNTSSQGSGSTVLTPWVQIQKTSSPGSTRSPLQNFARIAAARVKPLPQQTVEIISPKTGDTVFSQKTMMSVRVNASVETARIVVTNDNKEVFNSGVIDLPRRLSEANVWKPLIRLRPGTNTITVTGTDSSNPPAGQLTATVTVVQRGDTSVADERGGFEASAYVGYAIDTFAAGELRRYINPNDSGGVSERWVGGFDFAYRLFGNPTEQQLWVYGETVHGVRSTDVDCKANQNLAVCKDLFDPVNAPDATLFILRNATSLEAFAGLRWEFKTVNKTSDKYAANLYLKAQLGFLTVADGDEDIVDVHHVGFGAISTNGRYRGSYLEAGFGKTDLFKEHRNRRFKVDGYLSIELPGVLKDRFRPFAQMTVDSDFGKGADSIQSYFGLDFDLVCLFAKSNCTSN